MSLGDGCDTVTTFTAVARIQLHHAPDLQLAVKVSAPEIKLRDSKVMLLPLVPEFLCLLQRCVPSDSTAVQANRRCASPG